MSDCPLGCLVDPYKLRVNWLATHDRLGCLTKSMIKYFLLLLSLSPLVTPIVSSFRPPSMIVNVDDNGRVQFECMAAGPPELTTQGLLREFESKDYFNKAEK